MRVFTLAFLSAHPSQIPVLAKNMAVQGGEDHPFQNGPRFIPIPKVQVGQVRVISHLHSCGVPCGRHLGRGFFIPAAATTDLGGTPTCLPPSCDKVGQ